MARIVGKTEICANIYKKKKKLKEIMRNNAVLYTPHKLYANIEKQCIDIVTGIK